MLNKGKSVFTDYETIWILLTVCIFVVFNNGQFIGPFGCRYSNEIPLETIFYRYTNRVKLIARINYLGTIENKRH